MKSLLYYFKNYLKESILAPLLKLLEAAFELIVPLVIAYIVDTIIVHGNQEDLIAMILLLVSFAIVGVLVAVSAQYFASKAAVGFAKDLTVDLYQKVLTLPKERRDQLGPSSLLTRLSSDTLQIQNGINTFLRLFLRAPIVVFGALFMAFYISPDLSIIFLGMIAVLFVIVILISKISSSYFATIRKIMDRLVGLIQESISGMRVVRAFVQTDREVRQFHTANQSYESQQMKAGFLSASLTPLTFLVVNASLFILIVQGNQFIDSGLLEQGKLVALINYLLQILVELVKLVMVVTTLNQSFVSAKRVEEIFEQESENLLAPLPVKKSSYQNLQIEVDHLSFQYPTASETALSNISFKIFRGQTFGIIGGTGSGKSTLIDLFLHLYAASEGEVAVFQAGYSPKNLKEWRQQFALVPQQPQLFAGTVRTNLTLGLSGISDQELWNALEIAQAADFLREKEGLDTRVEAMGRNFSGGQKQRLTIARAVLQPAPILILDDATSALDYLTERRLLDSLKEKMPSKTLILISQRTNSLAVADSILVLDKGEQVGLGRHEQLLDHCFVYQEIARSQESKEVV
ncbi:ABC transporter ATP-binding protein [Streptococcus cameli]